jgi:hypothetical protein
MPSNPADVGARLQVETTLPAITQAQSLTGWRREFCLELTGDGSAKIFVRAVEQPSHKAPELQRGVLFHRLDSRFADLDGCIDALRPDLDRLVLNARRAPPDKARLFITLDYDRAAWERVEQGLDRWARR